MKNSHFYSVSKTLLIAVLLFTFHCSFLNESYGQTNISGTIKANTTWAVSGSPYIITGNTVIDSGFTLTIDPGVTVKFNTDNSLQISGALHAKGLNVLPINFTSNNSNPSPGEWGFIYFDKKSTSYDSITKKGSIMEYCTVEFGGGLSATIDNAAIRIEGVYPLINHCTVRKNLATGIKFFGENALIAGILKITNSEIYNNTSDLTGGISVNANKSRAFICYNKIHHNTGSLGGGIYSVSIHNLDNLISKNIIYNNTATYGGGIYIFFSAGIVSFNIIYNNTADHGSGIWRDNGASCCPPDNIISNNIIASNTSLVSDGAFYNSGGLNCYSNTIIDNNTTDNVANLITTGAITFNTITRNYASATPSSTIMMGGVPVNFNYNNIFGNKTTYEAWNANLQPNNIYMKHCWWGTTKSATVYSKIRDYSKDTTLGTVYFKPFELIPDTLAPISPPTNVIKTDLQGGNVMLSWDKNTETDIAGYKVYYGSATGYSYSNFIDVGNVTSFVLTGVNYTDTIAVTAYDKVKDGKSDQFEGHESWYTRAAGISQINFTGTPLAICKGQTVQFHDNTLDVDTRTWTFQGGTPEYSTVPNPVVYYKTGGHFDVSLEVTNNLGSNTLKKTAYIKVNSPTAEAGSNQQACEGTQVTLTASGGVSYKWNNGITQGIPFPAKVTTVYYVTATDSIGCNAVDSVRLIVNPAPNVFILPNNHSTYCPGTKFSLNAYNAYSYEWSPATGISATTGSTVDVTATYSITYTVTGTGDYGCKAKDSVTINVYPISTFTIDPPNPEPFCAGGSIDLKANGNLNFVWSPSEGLDVIYGANVVATPAKTTTYKVQGLDAYQCLTTDSVTVTINPKPLKPTISRSGAMLSSDAAFGNQWYNLFSGMLHGETGTFYYAYTSGIYYVIVSDYNNCQSDSSNHIEVLYTGLNQPKAPSADIDIFPNPATDIIFIHYSNYNISEPTTLKIYTLLGQKVFEKQLAGSEEQIDVSKFEKGAYFIRITNDKDIIISKFVKE